MLAITHSDSTYKIEITFGMGVGLLADLDFSDTERDKFVGPIILTGVDMSTETEVGAYSATASARARVEADFRGTNNISDEIELSASNRFGQKAGVSNSSRDGFQLISQQSNTLGFGALGLAGLTIGENEICR